MAGTCDGSPRKADIVCISLIHQIMKIQGKEIVADEGMLIRRTGQGQGYTRCLLLPGETEKDFEEAELFSDDEQSEKPSMEAQMETFARMMTRTMTTIPDEIAVEMPEVFDNWESLIGNTLVKDRVISHNGKTYRVLMEHQAQKQWVPGASGSESLYVVIDKKHKGTPEDPIPYNGNMELFEGKYYSQNGVTYKCTRSTGQAVYHDLSALVGIYVEKV